MGVQAFVLAPGAVGVVIQPAVIGHVDRFAVDKRGAAIVRNVVLVFAVGDVKEARSPNQLSEGAISVCSSLPKLRQ